MYTRVVIDLILLGNFFGVDWGIRLALQYRYVSAD